MDMDMGMDMPGGKSGGGGKRAANKPAAKKSAAKKSAAKKSAMKKPAAKKSAANKPSGGGNRARAKTIHVQDHEIVLRELADDESVEPSLTIDGVDVMLMREEPTGVSAPMLNMHAVFPTVEDLARSLVVTSPVFLR